MHEPEAPETADEIAARFDERAEDYDESELHRRLALEVANLAEVAGVREVVDVATGTALVLRALAPRLDHDAGMTGVDLSAGMLAVAGRELPAARFIQGDALDLPFGDGTVDLLTCVAALHLMPDPVAALGEWARVLAPGGRILLATFTGQTRYGRAVTVDDLAAATGLTVLRSIPFATDETAEHGHQPLRITELAGT